MSWLISMYFWEKNHVWTKNVFEIFPGDRYHNKLETGIEIVCSYFENIRAFSNIQ